MSGTRLKSELLAMLGLSAGDKLAVASVPAALVALPDRAREPQRRPVARWLGRTAVRVAGSGAAVACEFDAGHLAAARECLRSSEGRTGLPVAAAGTGPDRRTM